MLRLTVLAASAAALFAFAPAQAQGTRGYYVATPATAPEAGSFVTRTTVWNCAGGACTAPKSTSRDAIICELAAKQVGTLQSFTANGSAFDADALAKCNSRAK